MAFRPDGRRTLPVKKTDILTLPNAITAVRFVGAIVMIFTKACSTLFYIIYSVSGVSDVLDGLVARMTGKTSEFGAKLDSVSDLLFHAVMLIKTFPKLYDILPVWIWAIVGGILLLRVICYTFAAVKFHRFASLHTYLNKATGTTLFALPYFLLWGEIPTTVISFTICGTAILAVIEELTLHFRAKEYDPEAHGAR